MAVRVLRTPPLPLLWPEQTALGVFDAFRWCESDLLTWKSPRQAIDLTSSIDGSDPTRMVFVAWNDETFVPTELARLHAFGLGLTEERALAPYAIDDATDALFENRRRPGDVFWLAADNLNALFWGLHDWAHFHNHGAFIERAWTEIQCDASALVWLWINRHAIGLDEATWERTRASVARLNEERFASEKKTAPCAILSATQLLEGALTQVAPEGC